MKHLPATIAEVQDRNWDRLDIVLVTGDANVDHPSFPANLLGRLLEAEGYRVGILARPDITDPASIAALGLPRLFFGVTAGSLDSMVANYTALKRKRSDDPFAPDGSAGGRPDRAVTVYCNLIRRAFGKDAFIVAGGLEASLRRFAHYDYWSDSVRRSLLMDCGADVLVHGMGEGPIVEIARRLAELTVKADRLSAIQDMPGVVYREPRNRPEPVESIRLASAEEVAADPVVHSQTFTRQEKHAQRRQWQDTGGMRVIANPPWPPMTTEEIDRIYSLPFTRDAHPIYGKAKVPALEQVRFSLVSHRGCFGGCAFCAIGAHQGKAISSRSPESILAEARDIIKHPGFRGTINDLGGPTANMYGLGCKREHLCDRPSCLWPKICKDLETDQQPYRELLLMVRNLPGVKNLFVTTGIRTDLALLCEPLVEELGRRHTGGQMKVAPEHVSPLVLHWMRKETVESFVDFMNLHRRISREEGKQQFVLPYIMAAYPGSRMEDMVEVVRFMRKHNLVAEQCQIFTPTPGTAATVMYATGLDPATLKPIYVEKEPARKGRQKALILYHLPENRKLVADVLARHGEEKKKKTDSLYKNKERPPKRSPRR